MRWPGPGLRALPDFHCSVMEESYLHFLGGCTHVGSSSHTQ